MTSKGRWALMTPDQRANHTATVVIRTRKRIFEHIIAIAKELGGKCVECGENRVILLQADHVDNDGALHRRGKAKGLPWYKETLRTAKEEPERLQLLCATCHHIKTKLQSRSWGYFEEYTGVDPLTATVDDFT